MVLLDFRRKPLLLLLLLFFDPAALGGYISDDEEKAEAEEAEEDIEILITQSLAEGCEEEKKSVGLVFCCSFLQCRHKQSRFFLTFSELFQREKRATKKREREKEEDAKKRRFSFACLHEEKTEEKRGAFFAKKNTNFRDITTP